MIITTFVHSLPFRKCGQARSWLYYVTLWFISALQDCILQFECIRFEIVYDTFCQGNILIYSAIFKVLDITLNRLFRIHFLAGSRAKTVVYALHLLVYFHFLRTNSAWREDYGMLFAVYTCSNAVLVLKTASGLYCDKGWQLIALLLQTIDEFGWKRCLLYCASVISAALLVTFIVTSSLSMSWNSTREEVLGRLENNVLDIEEDRRRYTEVMVHPITKGEEDPKLFHKVYRYAMEDVKMKCCVKMVYLADGRPDTHLVAWRRNGVPIKLTDRHHHELSFREVPDTESLYHRLLRSKGISQYEINATLTIHLLRSNEFGSYTCHVKSVLNLNQEDYVKNDKLLRNRTDGNSSRKKKTKEPWEKFFDDVKRRAAQNIALEPKRLFKDVFTWKDEFRLIRMKPRQETIRSPPSSILSFTHSYWHVCSQDDFVEVDYTVNGEPFRELCPDAFHGCSKFLMLYWFWGHRTGEEFGLPPLTLFTIWNNPSIALANRYTLVHCLCERAYGYHRVHYIRRYYNQTTKREELIEILHPHTLVVVPRERHMLDLFVNRSECIPLVERPPCEQVPPVCLSGWDFRFIKEFASMAVRYFKWTELAILAVMLVVTVIGIRNASCFLGCVGRQIERLTLHGSLGFYRTAIGALRPQNGTTVTEEKNCSAVGRTSPMSKKSKGQNTRPLARNSQSGQCNRKQQEGRLANSGKRQKNSCLYLSYAEVVEDQDKVKEVLSFLEENLGLSVIARNRDGDIPSGQPEIHGVTEAIENSKRVVIFLSDNYLQDSFMSDIEAPSIVECFCDRDNNVGPQDVLVVKLAPCQVPLWASRFEVHDWTPTNLTLQDHLLRLMRWLEPRERRSVFRSVLDFVVSILPTLVIAAVFLGFYIGVAN